MFNFLRDPPDSFLTYISYEDVEKQEFSYIYMSFFRFFSIIGYYKMLNIVPCAIQ